MYITKWALTSGINWRVLSEDYDKYKGSYSLEMSDKQWNTQLISIKYCHENMSDAIAHAEKLREAKMASLEKQMIKLKNKTF